MLGWTGCVAVVAVAPGCCGTSDGASVSSPLSLASCLVLGAGRATCLPCLYDIVAASWLQVHAMMVRLNLTWHYMIAVWYGLFG